jgi:tetratricopeptide (TPR) repeat protein
MPNLSSIVEEINQQINGEVFARLIEYHPDKIQISGGTLKCFCPVHHELAFRSLIFNLKTHTYKCMMKRCECFDGGTFVQFWSIYRNMGLVESALDLADKLRIDIDVETFHQLGSNYQVKAESALDEGDLAAAREAVDQAIAMDSRNLNLRLLSAQVYQAAGETGQAVNEQALVLDELIDQKELAKAEDILQNLLEATPDSPEYLEREIRLRRLKDDRGQLIEAINKLAVHHEENQSWIEAIKVRREITELKPGQPEPLENLVQLYKKAGEAGPVSEILGQLVDIYQQQDDSENLLVIQNRLAELNPENLELREQITNTLETIGEFDKARDQWISLTETYCNQARYDQALSIIDRLLEKETDNVKLLERRAVVLNQAGRSDEAITLWRTLAAMAREVGLTGRVNEYFEQAMLINPNDLSLRQDQTEWKLSTGDLDGGLNDLFGLADLHLEQSQVKEGRAILNRIASLASSDIDKRLRIGRCLERNGFEDEAFQSYCALIHDLVRQNLVDAAVAICEEARRLKPLDMETLNIRVDVYMAQNQKSEAIETCREVAAEFKMNSMLDQAEQALQHGVKLDRSETGAKSDLARLYEETGCHDKAVTIWLEMALFHKAQNQIDQANQSVREALALDPDNRKAKVMLAEGLEAAGRIGEAQEIWKSLGHELKKNDPSSSEALVYLVHAHELDPRDHELLAETAQMKLELDGPEEARPIVSRWMESLTHVEDQEFHLEGCRLAVNRYPNEVSWRKRLAYLLLETGFESESAGHFEKLLQAETQDELDENQKHLILENLVTICPDRMDLRVDLAQSMARYGRPHEAVKILGELTDHYIKLDDLDQGLKMLETALEIRPTDRELLDRTGSLYEQAGQVEEAVAKFENLAEMNRRDTDRSINVPVLEKLLVHNPDRDELMAELAELYELEGDIDKAVEHNFKLAQTWYKRGGQGQKAVDCCLRIKSMLPEFIPSRELMVESLLQLDRIDEAKDELDKLGDLALASHETERAEKYFKRVMEIVPDDISSGERLGKLYEARGSIAEATEAYNHVLHQYEDKGDYNRAIQVIQKLKYFQPDDLNLRCRLAGMLLDSGIYRKEAGEEFLQLIEICFTRDEEDQAIEYIQSAKPLFSLDWSWRIKLARLMGTTGKPGSALTEWSTLACDAIENKEYEIAREASGEGLLIDSHNTVIREFRIQANRLMSNYDQAVKDLTELAERFAAEDENTRAEKYLVEAFELQPTSTELLEMLAEVQLAANAPEKAEMSIRKLVEIYRQQSAFLPAVRWTERMVELQPDNDELKDKMAALYMDSDRQDEAIDLWKKIADTKADEGEIENACSRYTRILEYLPGNVEILRRLADLTYETGGMLPAMAYYDRLMDVLLADEDPETIENEYRRILEMEPGHLQLKGRLADFLLSQDREDESIDILREIVEEYHHGRDQKNDALRILRRIKSTRPDDLSLREEEADLLFELERSDEACQAWRQIATSYRRLETFGRAADCLTRAAQLAEDDVEIQLEIAHLHEQNQNAEKATEYLLKAIEILDRSEQLDACIPVLERAIDLNPDRFDLSDALARIHERRGEMDLACGQWLNLGELYEMHDLVENARKIYGHVLALLPKDLESRSRLAGIYESQGENQHALQELGELARLSHQSNDWAEEVGYLDRMLKLDPQNEFSLRSLVDVWRIVEDKEKLFETLGRLEAIYCQSNQLDDAIQVVEEMKVIHPDDPELVERSVNMLIRTGKSDDAARYGIELIQIYFDQNDDHHALEALRRIAELDPSNIERQISLAHLVYSNGRDKEAQQEFFLLASKLFGDTGLESALDVCEAGLGLYPNDVRLRDMMGRIYLKLGRHSEAIEVQLHLASLYDEKGEQVKAQRVYESILANDPDHLGTLEAMIDWALRHEKTSLAIENLLRLSEAHYLASNIAGAIESMERIQSLDPRRYDLKARLGEMYLETGDIDAACMTWVSTGQELLREEQAEQAIGILEMAYNNRSDHLEGLNLLVEAYLRTGRSNEHQEHALLLGELHLGQKRVEKAIEIFEDLVEAYEHDPRALNKLADLYLQCGDRNKTVEVHQKLFQIHIAGRNLDEARRCLENALELQPENIEIIIQLGDTLLSMSLRVEGLGYFAKAISLLREQCEYEQARNLALRYLKLEPLNPDIRSMLAQTYEQLNEVDAAMDEYVHAARGYADTHMNEPAILILTHVLTLHPNRRDERELYARLLHREKQVDACVDQYLLLESTDDLVDPRRKIKYCRQILSDVPDHPEAHGRLADIYETTGKLRQAFKECEWLIDYHTSKGQQIEVERHIRRALEWFPEELNLRKKLIDILNQMGRSTESVDQLSELARKAEERSDHETTAWAMARICDIEPDNMEHYASFSEFLDRTGDHLNARERRIEMIQLMLQNGAMQDACELADRVLEAASENDELRFRMADLFEHADLPEIAAFHFHHLARRALNENNTDRSKTLTLRVLELKHRHIGARGTLIDILLAEGDLKGTIEQYHRLYELYEEAEDWDAALRTIKSLVELDPQSIAARRIILKLYRRLEREDAVIEQLRELADLHADKDDLESAQECLRELMSVRPDDTRALVSYIEWHSKTGNETDLKNDYLQLARIYSRGGNVVEAIQIYEKLMVVHPDDSTCRLEFVQFLFDKGQTSRGVDETRSLIGQLELSENHEQMEKILDRALNYAPNELDLRHRMALIYLNTNRRGLALETFRSLSRLYEQEGQDAELIQIVEKIVEIDDLNVEFRQRLADLYYRNERLSDAGNQFKLLADQYFERGLYDLAVHEYRRALDIFPDQSELWQQYVDTHLKIGSITELVPDLVHMADAQMSDGKPKDASKTLKKLMEYQPDDIKILTRYIDAYLQVGLDQDLLDDYLHLADLRIRNGEMAEAIRIYRHLIEISPDNAVVQEKLTATQTIFSGRGQASIPKKTDATPLAAPDPVADKSPPDTDNQTAISKLVRNYENVLSLNPNNWPARSKLAELLEQNGKPNQADKHWRLAAETCFHKAELDRCIEFCRHYLNRQHQDNEMQELLSKATVQRDSMRTIDGALSKELEDF